MGTLTHDLLDLYGNLPLVLIFRKTFALDTLWDFALLLHLACHIRANLNFFSIQKVKILCNQGPFFENADLR